MDSHTGVWFSFQTSLQPSVSLPSTEGPRKALQEVFQVEEREENFPCSYDENKENSQNIRIVL
jgi:hypothetical protein